MIETTTVYDLLGDLVVYPEAHYHERLRVCSEALRDAHPEAARALQPFADLVSGMPLADLEEFYTRTFDINPPCCLEVGWQLFGEDYARGAFLVTMRQNLRKYGLAESTELPDHLTHVLALLGRLDPRDADELATCAALPALKKMIDGLAGKDNRFECVLKAVERVLTDRHAVSTEESSDA